MKSLREDTVQKVTNYLRTSDENQDPTYAGGANYLDDKGETLSQQKMIGDKKVVDKDNDQNKGKVGDEKDPNKDADPKTTVKPSDKGQKYRTPENKNPKTPGSKGGDAKTVKESVDYSSPWYQKGYDHGYEGKSKQHDNKHYNEGHEDGLRDYMHEELKNKRRERYDESTELSEVSKAKLARYIKGASEKSNRKSEELGEYPGRGIADTEKEDNWWKQSIKNKRRSDTHIPRAVDKLTGQAKVNAKD